MILTLLRVIIIYRVMIGRVHLSSILTFSSILILWLLLVPGPSLVVVIGILLIPGIVLIMMLLVLNLVVIVLSLIMIIVLSAIVRRS